MPVRYVIASGSAATLAVASENLGSMPDVEYRMGTVPETWSGCDAMVMWWPLAYERHDGIPEPGVSHVLRNIRGDDAPEAILATPPGPGLTTGVDPAESDRAAFSYFVLKACLEAYRNEVSGHSENPMILIHLEASGLDQRDMEAPLQGISRFLTEQGFGKDSVG